LADLTATRMTFAAPISRRHLRGLRRRRRQHQFRFA
jgi:hypothetical protein